MLLLRLYERVASKYREISRDDEQDSRLQLGPQALPLLSEAAVFDPVCAWERDMPSVLSRSEVVEAMCLTWRHDFGVDRTSDFDLSGFTDADRAALRSAMGQLFDQHIAPAIAAEREACAQMAESHGPEHMKVQLIAAQIRGRAG